MGWRAMQLRRRRCGLTAYRWLPPPQTGPPIVITPRMADVLTALCRGPDDPPDRPPPRRHRGHHQDPHPPADGRRRGPRPGAPDRRHLDAHGDRPRPERVGGVIPHGSVARLRPRGCREEPCSAPRREYVAQPSRRLRRRHRRGKGLPGRPQHPTESRRNGAAFAYLDAHGYSHRRIADVLGVTDRTVCRWRANAANPRGRGVA
jgi:hypothetical protein